MLLDSDSPGHLNVEYYVTNWETTPFEGEAIVKLTTGHELMHDDISLFGISGAAVSFEEDFSVFGGDYTAIASLYDNSGTLLNEIISETLYVEPTPQVTFEDIDVGGPKPYESFNADLQIRNDKNLLFQSKVKMWVDGNLYDEMPVTFLPYGRQYPRFTHHGLPEGEHYLTFNVETLDEKVVASASKKITVELNQDDYVGEVTYEAFILDKHLIGDQFPVRLTIHNDADGSFEATVKAEIDDEMWDEVKTYNVGEGASFETTIYLPAFNTEGDHTVRIYIYDKYGDIVKDEKYDIIILQPDNLRIVEQFGDTLTDEAEYEIDEMLVKLTDKSYDGGKGVASVGMSRLTGPISKLINSEFSAKLVELGVSENTVSLGVTVMIDGLEIMDLDGYTGLDQEIKGEIKEYYANKVKSNTDNIGTRQDNFEIFINNSQFVATPSSLHTLSEVTYKGYKTIDGASDYATFKNQGIAGSDFSIPWRHEKTFDGCMVDINDLQKTDSEVSAVYLGFLIAAIIALIFLGPEITLGSAILASATTVLTTASVAAAGVILKALPTAGICFSVVLAGLVFSNAAVPYVEDQHDQSLDTLQLYIQNYTEAQASVSQVEIASIENNAYATATTTLDSSTTDSIITMVYSPDGRLVKTSIEKSPVYRTATTSSIPIGDESGIYTVASGTFKDLDENNFETTSFEIEFESISCGLTADKNVYSPGDTVTLTANFVNTYTVDQNAMSYYIGLNSNVSVNETGTINLPANSTTTVDFDFTVDESGAYHPFTILFGSTSIECQSETSFIVGNGSSIGLTAQVPELFEPGVVPVANISIECAGDVYSDTLTIRTSSIEEENYVYESLTEYDIGSNSTATIEASILNVSKPGTYTTHISYGNRMVSKKFMVAAENTIHISPLTDKMIYDLGETITVNITSKNQSLSLNSFEFGVEHVYPNGTIETVSKSETTTGNYVATLNANVNGTHYLRTKGESNTMRVYAEETFFIVSKRSNPYVSNTYYSNETGVIAFEITNDESVPVKKASVMFNNTSSFTDDMGYVSFVETGANNLTLEIKKPGYSSYYGVYQALDPIEDNVLPTVGITSIQEGAVYDDSFIYLSGTLEDNVSVEDAYYIINNESLNSLYFDETGNFSVLIEDSRLVYGENSISVVAYDICGNAGEETVTFTLEEPLRIIMGSPVNGSTYVDIPEFDVTSNKEANLLYSLNGQENVSTTTELVPYVDTGENTLTVYATDLSGNTASKEVTFYYDPVPAVSFIANVTSGNIPLSVQFMDTSTNSPQSWAWDFGDGAMSTVQDPVHVYTDVGNFSVTLTTNNATGSDSMMMEEYVKAVNESGGSDINLSSVRNVIISNTGSDGALTDFQYTLEDRTLPEYAINYSYLHYYYDSDFTQGIPQYRDEDDSSVVTLKLNLGLGNTTIYERAEEEEAASDLFSVFDLIEGLETGGTITASMSLTVGVIDNILDNNISTYAYYKNDYSTYIVRDFGETVDIHKLRAAFGSKYATEYIKVSNDGSTWTTIASWSGDIYRSSLSPWYDVNSSWRYIKLEKSGAGWHSYHVLNVLSRQSTANTLSHTYTSSGNMAEFSNNKLIAISPPSDGTLTDYQMSFDIDYEAEMQADFDDIRFTDENDVLLPYWIESKTNSSSANVWVKIPEIDAVNGATVKMYYGNSTVSSTENGTNVFEFFDDFNRANSGTIGNDWAESSGNTAEILDNRVRIGTDTLVYRPFDSRGHILEVDTQLSNTYGNRIFATTNGVLWNGLAAQYRRDTGLVQILDSSAGTSLASTTIATDTSLYATEFVVKEDYSTEFRLWDKESESRPETSSVSYGAFTPTTTTQNVGFSSNTGSGNYHYFDNFRIRKYASSEPSYNIQ